MALHISPRQFSDRSEFYHQLATYVGAGIILPNALEQLRRNPPSRSYREPVARILSELSRGCTFVDALTTLGRWVPVFDLALLQAGEESGRLDACFRLLSDYYRDRAQIARQLISDLIYPLFLLHFAVLIFAFVRFVARGTLTGFVWQVGMILVPLYVLVFLMIFAAQSRHGEAWRSVMERFLGAVPVLGGARRSLALARLAAALEALLNAGVSIVPAWELAAAASGSPALRRTVAAWRPQIEAGVTPAEAVKRTRVFPHLFADQYATGELTGSLDQCLRRLYSLYQDEGMRKLHAFTQWTPRAIYFAVMLLIAAWVVKFYVGYFQQIGAAGGF